MSSFYDGWMTVGRQANPLWIVGNLSVAAGIPICAALPPLDRPSVRKRENRLAAGILDLGHPQLLNRVDELRRHRDVVELLRHLAALGISPIEESEHFGCCRRIARLLVHEHESGTGHRP